MHQASTKPRPREGPLASEATQVPSGSAPLQADAPPSGRRHVDESINIFLVDSAEHHREQAELQRTPSADLATTRGHQATTEIAPSTPTLATSPSALRYGFASVTQGTASKPALPPRATDNPLTQLNARRFPRHSRSASGMWDRERDRLWERVEVGDPDALVEMALLLLTSGGTRDPKKDALDLLERAAAKGSAEAMYKISLLL